VLCCLAAPAAARPVPRPRCTVTLSPHDDLQRAIDRVVVARRPARVCLGAGEFRLERFLSLTGDGVTLRGEGPSTVLRLAEGVESPVVVVGDHGKEVPRRATSNVTIERLRIVGGGPGGRELHPEYPYLTNSAVVVRAGRGIIVRDLDVTACRSACILTEHESRDVRIEGNRVGDSVWDGISLNRTARARVAENVILGNGAAGITTEHLEDSVIERNVVRANKTHGLYLSDSYRNTVVGNRFVDNVLSGVFLTCALHDRTPRPVCWQRSMSQGNAFVRNEFTANRVGFTAAPDAAARCRSPGFVANRSSGDVFRKNPRDEPGPPAYGRCLVFA